jgi:hypothetical protein
VVLLFFGELDYKEFLRGEEISACVNKLLFFGELSNRTFINSKRVLQGEETVVVTRLRLFLGRRICVS